MSTASFETFPIVSNAEEDYARFQDRPDLRLLPSIVEEPDEVLPQAITEEASTNESKVYISSALQEHLRSSEVISLFLAGTSPGSLSRMRSKDSTRRIQ